MRLHPSKVIRTRIRVIRVNFSETLIKGKQILFELAGISISYLRSTVISRDQDSW